MKRNDMHTRRLRFRDEPEDFTDMQLDETIDVEHPEYFFGGCGTSWNTFATRGICPTCLHQWKWTSCLRCFMWSMHEDWYEAETD